MYIDASAVRKPIGILMIEHRLIERALNALEQKAANPGSPLPVLNFGELIDFFGTYADATHHGKEEDILFTVADEKPLSEDLVRVLAELREDHVQFRKYRRGLAAANQLMASGDASALAEFQKLAREFVPRLRAHIQKEDKLFFPGFDQLEKPADREAMMARFRAFDAELAHTHYREVVERNE